jgi:hypothetical protein
MKRKSLVVSLLVASLTFLGGTTHVLAQTPATSTPDAPRATLLAFNTVERLLAGDLLHTVTISAVQTSLAAFPSDWPVVGLGTTNRTGRNGELAPDGTAGALRLWWADPDSTPQGNIVNLADNIPPDVGFPFIGLAVGNPSTAIVWTAQNVPDVHAWLEQKLAAQGIDLAGVQLFGEFGAVKTTVAYNLPLTGLDLSSGYAGPEYFRFGEYVTHTWTMDGLYAADPALTRVISTPKNPLQLHGYEGDVRLGGHVGSAQAISLTATVWPLEQMVISRGPARPLARD